MCLKKALSLFTLFSCLFQPLAFSYDPYAYRFEACTQHKYSSVIDRAVASVEEAINPSLRRVSFDFDEDGKKLTLYFYHDGKIVPSCIQKHYENIFSKVKDEMRLESNLISYQIIPHASPARYLDQQFSVYGRQEPFLDPK